MFLRNKGNGRLFDKFYSYVILLFGIFSILEVFKYKVGGISIYFADAFFYLYTLCNIAIISIHNKDRFLIKPQYQCIWLSFIFLLIGSLNIWSPIIDNNIQINDPKGIKSALKYLIKTVILIFVFYTILKLPKKFKIISWEKYTVGFIAGVFIHAYYSLFQAVMWYAFLDDIHTPFLNSIGITEDSVGHDLINFLINPVIRLCGLHWDPAYYGLWGAILILLIIYRPKVKSKYKILYNISCLILMVTWILSFSRTGYLALAVAIIIMQLCSHYNISIRKIKRDNFFKICFTVCCLTTVLWITLPPDVQKNFEVGFKYRFSHDENDVGSNRHIMYPLYTLEGILHDPFHFFLGYGARNSSRAILYGGNIKEFVSTKEAFDIESDICRMIANYGIIYFFAYIFFNYNIIRLYVRKKDLRNKDNLFYLISIITIFVSGIFYAYNDSKWVWFIYLFALINLGNTNTDLQINGKGRFYNNNKLQYN